MYFDGERYYTKEEFFNPDEEKEENHKPKKMRKWMKVTIASIVTVALLANVLSMWPQLFNLASIEFLAISRELSENEDVQLYKESVVVVKAGSSKGTGFYISEDGHIITNEHVVDDARDIFVTFQGGESHRAEVISKDEDIDIAILQINGGETERPVLEFDNTWETGMPVYIVGNPLFFNYIANKGHILDLMPDQGQGTPMLMIDAPIYKGNSGSPVINHDGGVVGVVFATTRVEHDGSKVRVGLAVPVEYFEEYLDFDE